MVITELMKESTSVWIMQYLQDAITGAEAFIKSHATTTLQSKLLETYLSELRPQADNGGGFIPSVHLPFLVYAGVTGDDKQAVPLAVALFLLDLGIDLLDNIADNELLPEWQEYNSSVLQLAATEFAFCLPHLALTKLDASPTCLLTMHQMIVKGLLKACAGQEQDLELQGSSNPSIEDIQASVRGKSGERWGMFAALGAQFGGASLETVEAYADMGRSLGMTLQFTSDCADIFSTAHSRDLANGTRTLPIGLHLQQLTGTERADFLDLLAQAKVDQKAQEEVRASLLRVGGLRRSALFIEYFRQQTQQSLEKANPLEPAMSRFKQIISDVCVLSLEVKK
ncbi:class 1 isoprenoid biosynthesis enzyme [Nostoc sp.]|uniref:class 1 isoprenoid biosynthesis enzyme n=1 Tax=Nostoc sp. TaxID=1180 RepID=UPI002FF5E5BD